MSQYPQNLLGALCNNPDMIDFVKGYFLLIPELESYDKILRSLGVIS